MKRFFSLFLLLLMPCIPLEAKPTKPTFRFELKRPGDSIVALEEKERTVFVVSSKSGISEGTLQLSSGGWPQDIVLRFQYADTRGFKTLEGLNLTTAWLLTHCGQWASGKAPFFLPDDEGHFDVDGPSAGQLNIVVEKRDHGIEVVLPPHLFVGSKEVKFFCVDAYRG